MEYLTEVFRIDKKFPSLIRCNDAPRYSINDEHTTLLTIVNRCRAVECALYNGMPLISPPFDLPNF